MARLSTLGAVELTEASGRPVDAILSRQRRVALLIYLAIEARDGFVRRESLFGVFWPELDQSRARAALRQSLYVLRSELGEELVVTRGADEVGLAPSLQCDAVEFAEHLAAGRFDAARALYRGPFLNGFFIGDAPEFERWVDERRQSLRRDAARCALQLTADARGQGDIASAVRHLRDALDLEPTDESTLRALMMTLEDSGDRAAALREFAQYSETLQKEYELEPSAETSALADAIRNGTRDAQGPISFEPRRASPIPGMSEGPRATGRPFLRWAAAAAVLVVATGMAGMWGATRARSLDRDEPRLVVMPFEVRGGNDIAYLGEGMADLLSTSLDGPDFFRVVPPTIVLRDIRERSQSGPRAPVETARRFGAQNYVLGSVVAGEGKLRFDARMFSLGNETAPLAQASVEGSPDSVFSLVDQLSARLIADSRGRGPAKRLQGSAALTTRSLSALKDYLAGERSLREGAFGPAIEFFRKATTTDSTFALAYYRMSMAAEWNADQPLGLRMAAIANRHGRRLSTRDAALLRAHYDMLRGAVDDAERQYRVILSDSPDELEAWLKVGEILFHNNPTRGRPLSEAREPFERVLSYDRTHRAALVHLVRIAAAERDLDRVDSLAARYLALNVSEGALSMRVLVAATRGDTAAIAQMARAAATVSDEGITDAARDLVMFARIPSVAIAILRANIAPARGAERNAMTNLQIAAIELGRGDGGAADAAFDEAARLGHTEEATYLQALYAIALDSPSRPELESLRKRIAMMKPARQRTARVPLMTIILSGSAPIRNALLAELSLSLGDTSAAHAYADAVSTSETPPGFEWVRDEVNCITRARIALREGRPNDALAELRRFRHPDDVALNRGFPWYALMRLTEADALSALGRGREAEPLWRSFEYQSLFVTPFIGPGNQRAAALAANLR